MLARLTSLLAAALGALALAGPAAAQIEAPPPEAPEELPDSADVVIPDRDLRMSRTGLAQLRLGCLGEDGDLCLGATTVSLARAVEIPKPQPERKDTDRDGDIDSDDKPPKVIPPDVIQPFTIARFDFGIVDGGVNTYRFKLAARAQRLLKRIGRIPVQLSADFAGKNGVRAVELRTVTMYLPAQPAAPPRAPRLR